MNKVKDVPAHDIQTYPTYRRLLYTAYLYGVKVSRCVSMFKYPFLGSLCRPSTVVLLQRPNPPPPPGALEVHETLFDFLFRTSEHAVSVSIRRAQSLSPTDHLAAFYLALQLAVSRQVTRSVAVTAK